jgi:lysyl-tRNA synthetase, class I
VFWADELAASVSGPQVVNDSKTPSGTIHVGSLRGPVLLDVIARALRDRGIETELRYGIDDLDPMDAQALLTPDAVERAMGVPLARVPDPAGDGHDSYARHFSELFTATFEGLGIRPDVYYRMSEEYASGRMDRYIRAALDAAGTIREIYLRVSHVERPPGWLPVHVICPTCGRIGTTLATDWDGETVAFSCLPDLVDWATGCGATGRLAPVSGAAKLPWNVDWAAKWSLFGVTIEPCGKDLATGGGSRDRADAIAREVFRREPPVRVDYEFLNLRGRKMSTSKGTGAAAHEIAEVIPAEQLRLLFLRPRPNQAIEFDPVGTDAIPRLFDESDRLAAATAGLEFRGELPGDHERLFAMSLVRRPDDLPAEAAAYRPPFAHLAFLIQVPGIDVAARFAAEKGEPLTARERAILDERIAAAQGWLAGYAPDRARVMVHERLPASARALDEAQRTFLGSLGARLATLQPWTGEVLQAAVFDAARELGLPAGRAFTALYVAFLDRQNGPRAGWLLASLEPAFVRDRLRGAAGNGTLDA